MEITFDPEKDAINRRKHGISLDRAEDFDFDAAYYVVDDRRDYGEVRFRAISFLDGKLTTLVFVQDGDAIRPISLRKSNKREGKEYAEAQ